MEEIEQALRDMLSVAINVVVMPIYVLATAVVVLMMTVIGVPCILFLIADEWIDRLRKKKGVA